MQAFEDPSHKFVSRLEHSRWDSEHTLLRLYFHGLDDNHLDSVHRAIECVTKRLWGPVSSLALSRTDLLLFLERWPGARGGQFGELLVTAARQGLARKDADGSIHLELVTFRGPARLSDLLDRMNRVREDRCSGALENDDAPQMLHRALRLDC